MKIGAIGGGILVGLSVVAFVAICSTIGYTMGTYNNAPKSSPEVVFESDSVLKCTNVGTVKKHTMIRCTDTERDVTCYVIRGVGGDPLTCLPNQWLNYPASIGNVNDPIAQ